MHTGYTTSAALLVIGAMLLGCASAPPFQGLNADQLFEMGAAKFQEEDWDEAVDVFERVISVDPTFGRLVEARMYLARAYYNRGDYITAVSEFNRILDRHPGHVLAPEASLGICHSLVAQSPHVQRDQTYTAQAWTACQNTVADFGGHEVGAEATELRDQMLEKLAEKTYVTAEFYLRRKVYQPAILYYNELVDQFPNSQWIDDALLGLYRAYTATDWQQEAEEARSRILRDFPDSEAAKIVGSTERSSEGGVGGSGFSNGEREDPQAGGPGRAPSSGEHF
jgi:outer membrane protein assembly factor BamD